MLVLYVCSVRNDKTYLYIVALMVVAALSEQSMMHYLVDVQLVQKRISILVTNDQNKKTIYCQSGK